MRRKQSHSKLVNVACVATLLQEWVQVSNHLFLSHLKSPMWISLSLVYLPWKESYFRLQFMMHQPFWVFSSNLFSLISLKVFFFCFLNGHLRTMAFETFKAFLLLYKEEFLLIGYPFRFFSPTWNISILFFFLFLTSWNQSPPFVLFRPYHLVPYRFWKYVTNLIKLYQ